MTNFLNICHSTSKCKILQFYDPECLSLHAYYKNGQALLLVYAIVLLLQTKSKSGLEAQFLVLSILYFGAKK